MAHWFHLIGGGFYIANEAAWKTNSNYKMAAVIVRGGTLLSVGYNRIEDHPAAYFCCSFHAEYDAIRKAKADIAGAKMFVYRFSRSDNSVKTSRPCEICQYEISKANLSSAIFVEDKAVCKESFKDIEISSAHSIHNYIDNASCYIREA